MTERERKLLLIAGGGGLLLIGWLGFSSYFERRAELNKQLELAENQALDDEEALQRQSAMERKLRELRKDGLQARAAAAEQQLLVAGSRWRDEAGVRFTGVTTDKGKADKGFERIEQKMSVSGSQAAVAKLLWRAETTSLPVRVQSVSMTAREGTDQLNVQIGMSTLCETQTPAGKPPASR